MKHNAYGFGLMGIVMTLCALCIIVVAGYSVYSTNTDKAEVKTQEQSEKPETSISPEQPDKKVGTTITTGDSEFGTMLFDGSRQAIYIWELEDSSNAECYGDCAEAWPPVLTVGEPVAVGDTNPTLLGTTERTDGTIQVTYNGHPLYYYAHEEPGEVKCHDIKTHGGLWWVIQPNGNRAD